MTLDDLLEEFYARGFNYLSDTSASIARAKRWLNEAYLEDIVSVEPWPFLEQTSTGAAPLSLPDVGDVLYVVDTTNGRVLDSTDTRDIVASDGRGSLATQGVPSSYYLDGVDTLRVYPAAGIQVEVRYIGFPSLLSSGTDAPIVPQRFQSLIVDGAVVRAYRDNDEWEAAAAAQQALDVRLAKMTDTYFSRNFDNTQYVARIMDHEF